MQNILTKNNNKYIMYLKQEYCELLAAGTKEDRGE